MGCSISADTQVGRRRDKRRIYEEEGRASAGLKGKRECLLSPTVDCMEHYRRTTFFLESSDDEEDFSPGFTKGGEGSNSFSAQSPPPPGGSFSAMMSPNTAHSSGQFTPANTELCLPGSVHIEEVNSNLTKANTPPPLPAHTPPHEDATSHPLDLGLGGQADMAMSSEFGGSCSMTSMSLSPRGPRHAATTPSPRLRKREIKVITRASELTPRSVLKSNRSSIVKDGLHTSIVEEDDGITSETSFATQSSVSNFNASVRSSSLAAKRRVTFSWADDALDAALGLSTSHSRRVSSNTSKDSASPK